MIGETPKTMRASVIIAAYNREHMIDRAVDSIARQGLNGWEIIVIDDASTDKTRDKIIQWENRYPKNIIGLKFNEHQERVVAYNSGINTARGEWIIMLDSDDELSSHFIKAFEDARLAHPDAEFFSWGSVFHWFDKDTKRYVRDSLLQPFTPPQDEYGKVGVFRAGKITSGGFAFRKKDIWKHGFLPNAHNPYTLGERFLKWYPEVKPLYNPDQMDLGNPWGQDYMWVYHMTRGMDASKWVTLNQYLHIVHIRT